MFTHEARRNIPWSHLKYYKTKPPMKYQGINGFENSFRQLFNIITQVLELQIPRTSRSREQEDTQNSDWRLLDDKIKFIFFNLAYFDWSKDTTKEVVDFSSKNIQEFFENLGNHKAKLIKMMEANDIERIDKFLKFGNKLSEMIDKFKKEYSDYYSPH